MFNTNLGFSGRKLQVNLRVGPSSLEVVWVLVTPPQTIDGRNKLICACIYSPPRSKLNDLMLSHLSFNFSSLTAQHPGAGIVVGGISTTLIVTKFVTLILTWLT